MKRTSDDAEQVVTVPVAKVAKVASSSSSSAPPTEARLAEIIQAVCSQHDIIPALDIKKDDPIEVLWLLGDEENEEKQVWWEALMIEKTDKKHDFPDDDEEQNSESIDVPIYTIRYKKMHDFDESTSEVCFVDEHHLYDVAEESMLFWRKKGTDYVPPKDGQISPVENPILRSIDRVVKLNAEAKYNVKGKSAREAAECLADTILGGALKNHGEALSKLQASAQYAVADKIVKAKEDFTTLMTALIEKKNGQEINSEDIDSVMTELKERTSAV